MALFANASYYFAALLMFAVVAFWPSYFSKLLSEPSTRTHFHVLTMVIWSGLLILQPLLIRRREFDWHRRLGRFSYFLFPLMIAGFVLLAHEKIQNVSAADFPLRAYIFYLQIMAVCLLVISYGLALRYRRTAALHARFMICTGLTLVDPAVARVFIFWLPSLGVPPMAFPPQFVSYAIVDLIFIAMMVAERRQTRGRAVFPVMFAVFLVFQVLTFVLTAQPWWGDFARAFAALPLS